MHRLIVYTIVLAFCIACSEGRGQERLRLEQIARLSRETIVVYITVFDDGTGRPFVPAQVAEDVAYDLVKRYQRKDGAPIWVHIYLSTIPGEDFKPRLFLATTIDITARKLAEDAMRVAQSELAGFPQRSCPGAAAEVGEARA